MSEADNVQHVIDQAIAFARNGQYQQSIAKIDELGVPLPPVAEAVYVRAVSLRKLDRNDDARDALQEVLSLDPHHVRAYQELGHIFFSEKKVKEAIDAYEQAVARDAALIASWRALRVLYEKSGNRQGLARAQHELAQLEQLPPALQAVKSHLNRGQLDAADEICREYLQQNKQDIEGIRLLAAIAVQAKILDDAEFLLESAVTFNPNHIGARFDYAGALLKRQKFGLAHTIAEQLCEQYPGTIQFKALLAATTTGIGEADRGANIYRELIAERPDVPEYYLLLGHAEKAFGNLDVAIQAYQQLYEVQADFGDAFWSLANTKTYKFSDAEIAHMQDYLDRPATSDFDKVHFYFALGKALEDRKEFAAAFEAYERGNLVKKSMLDDSGPDIAFRVEHLMSHFDTAFFDDLAGRGCEAADPIFVVGLPRAGSTLLEQILASHSAIEGTLELPNIPSLVHRLHGRKKIRKDEVPQYPGVLRDLEEGHLAKFGQQYIDDTQVFRSGTPYFIDKMPNNFLHIGLIKLILPNARIIDARRHPMACCFSGFKQLFAEGQEFTYGLQDIGDYYKQYVRLMDHWADVLPGAVLRVQYEDVVADLEEQVRRILDFLDLPFEDACVEFYRTKRSVRTPSSEQVRQPIYKSGLEQWRNFEAHLDPLKEALGEDVLRRYPI